MPSAWLAGASLASEPERPGTGACLVTRDPTGRQYGCRGTSQDADERGTAGRGAHGSRGCIVTEMDRRTDGGVPGPHTRDSAVRVFSFCCVAVAVFDAVLVLASLIGNAFAGFGRWDDWEHHAAGDRFVNSGLIVVAGAGFAAALVARQRHRAPERPTDRTRARLLLLAALALPVGWIPLGGLVYESLSPPAASTSRDGQGAAVNEPREPAPRRPGGRTSDPRALSRRHAPRARGRGRP